MRVRALNEPIIPAPHSIETQLALLTQEVRQLREDVTGRGADHETRIRGLEQFKWILFGVALASGPATTAIAQAIQ